MHSSYHARSLFTREGAKIIRRFPNHCCCKSPIDSWHPLFNPPRPPMAAIAKASMQLLYQSVRA